MLPKLLRCAVTVCAALNPGWSADIAVFRPLATNTAQSKADAVGAVLAAQYAANSGKVVLGPTATRRLLEKSEGNMAKAAQALGVEQYVAVAVVTLQEEVLVEATLFDRKGTCLHQTRMTAISLDDVTEVCDRLALSLAHGTSTNESRGLGNVTKAETREPKRLFAEKIIGVKTQTCVPYYAANKHGFDQLVDIGVNVRLESTKFMLEFGASGLFPATMGDDNGKCKMGGISIELGGNYYVLQSKGVGPYVGGGFSPRLLFEPGSVSLAPYVQAGLMFPRTHSARLYVDLKVAQHITPVSYTEWVDERSYPFREYEAHYAYYPTEVWLALGIGW